MIKRDVGLKPREEGDLPPEKLASILGRIYPEEVVDELMEALCPAGERKSDG